MNKNMNTIIIHCQNNPSRKLDEFLDDIECNKVTKRLHTVDVGNLNEDQENKLSAFLAVESLVVIKVNGEIEINN